MNRLRTEWSFREIELRFLSQVFHAFVATIGRAEKPPVDELVELRMDLSECQRTIWKKLVGLRILQSARDVEHFCQADHIRAVEIGDLCNGILRQPAATGR
jgi:hypothetical protein